MNRDVVSYGVIFLGSLFFMAMTWAIPRTDVTLVNSALFPRIVLSILITLSALGLFRALKTRDGRPMPAMHHAMWIVLGIISAFILLLSVVGFIISAGLFMTAFSIYMAGDYRAINIVRMTALGFAIAWGINYVFIEILSFILP